MNNEWDVVIIGAGPAGLSAGIELAVFDLRVIVLEAASEPGSTLREMKSIDYYPGFPDGVPAGKFVERMVGHAKKEGAIIRTNEEVINLSLKGKDKLVETTKSKYSAKAVIIASGTPEVQEEGWWGVGVFYCVECCKDFLRGRDLILIGSTSEAIDESLNLVDLPSRITLVNQANSIPLTQTHRAILSQKGVSLMEDRVAVRIGGKFLQKLVTLRSISNHEETTIKADGVVVIGELKPIIKILRKEGVKTHRQGCIIVDEHGMTNIDGVFAAGPCTSVCKTGVPRAVGEGSNVANTTRLYLTRRLKEKR